MKRNEPLKKWVKANPPKPKRATWRIDPGIWGPGGPKRHKGGRPWKRLI